DFHVTGVQTCALPISFPQGKGHLVPIGAIHPPLPGVLALRHGPALPPRRRVVHLDGRAAGATQGRDPQDELVPVVRPRARARLAREYARLDDLQEAVLGSRSADLRLSRMWHLRGYRVGT